MIQRIRDRFPRRGINQLQTPSNSGLTRMFFLSRNAGSAAAARGSGS